MTFEQYSAIVRQIIPHNVTIRREKLVLNGKGFIIDLAELKSANFIYGPSFIQELNAHNMTAELTFDTARTRSVFLTNVHNDIYCKEPCELIEEIKKASGKHIYKVHKFTGTGINSGCNYITVTADSRLSRDCIVREGYLNLFGKRVQTEFPKPKGRLPASMHAQTQSGNRHERTYQARPTNNHRNHEITNPPPRRENVWHRNDPHFQTQHNDSIQRFTDQYPLISETLRPRNHKNGGVHHPDFKSEFEVDFYIRMSDRVCKTMQSGLENPEDYLNSMNNINASYGIPNIIVTKEDLVLARNKFICKTNAPNNSINNDTYPSTSMINNTHPTNSPSMATDTDSHTSPSILNQTESLNSPNLPIVTDPSIPPTDHSILPSMQTPSNPSITKSMSNENDPLNSPSTSNDTDPTILSSMPNDPESSSMTNKNNPLNSPSMSNDTDLPSIANDSESSISSSMTNNTNSPVPPTQSDSSPPNNPSLSTKTTPRKSRRQIQKQQNTTTTKK